MANSCEQHDHAGQAGSQQSGASSFASRDFVMPDTPNCLRVSTSQRRRSPGPVGLVGQQKCRNVDCFHDDCPDLEEASVPSSPSTATSRSDVTTGEATPRMESLVLPAQQNDELTTPARPRESRPYFASLGCQLRAAEDVTVPSEEGTWAMQSMDSDSFRFLPPPLMTSEAENACNVLLFKRVEAMDMEDVRAGSPPPDRMLKPLSAPPPLKRTVRQVHAALDEDGHARRMQFLFNSPEERPMLHPIAKPPPLTRVVPLGLIDTNSSDGLKRVSSHFASMGCCPTSCGILPQAKRLRGGG